MGGKAEKKNMQEARGSTRQRIEKPRARALTI
jgi:hypothetical protein